MDWWGTFAPSWLSEVCCGRPAAVGSMAPAPGSHPSAAPQLQGARPRRSCLSIATRGPAGERLRLLCELFGALGGTSTQNLKAPELRRYAQLRGFSGSDTDWESQFLAMCEKFAWDVEVGINSRQFQELVDSEGYGVQSSQSLKAMLAVLSMPSWAEEGGATEDGSLSNDSSLGVPLVSFASEEPDAGGRSSLHLVPPAFPSQARSSTDSTCSTQSGARRRGFPAAPDKDPGATIHECDDICQGEKTMQPCAAGAHENEAAEDGSSPPDKSAPLLSVSKPTQAIRQSTASVFQQAARRSLATPAKTKDLQSAATLLKHRREVWETLFNKASGNPGVQGKRLPAEAFAAAIGCAHPRLSPEQVTALWQWPAGAQDGLMDLEAFCAVADAVAQGGAAVANLIGSNAAEFEKLGIPKDDHKPRPTIRMRSRSMSVDFEPLRATMKDGSLARHTGRSYNAIEADGSTSGCSSDATVST